MKDNNKAPVLCYGKLRVDKKGNQRISIAIPIDKLEEEFADCIYEFKGNRYLNTETIFLPKQYYDKTHVVLVKDNNRFETVKGGDDEEA